MDAVNMTLKVPVQLCNMGTCKHNALQIMGDISAPAFAAFSAKAEQATSEHEVSQLVSSSIEQQQHNGTDSSPLNARVCLQCETGEAETESHRIWRCQPGQPARKKLLEALVGIYPNVEQELKAMPCDERRTLMLLWTLPDGCYEGKVASKMKSEGAARVAATQAILNYLHATHVLHPGLKKYYQPWA